MEIEKKDYAWLILSQDGNIGIVTQDEIDLQLHELQNAVGGHIEIVAPFMLQYASPYLRMVVDDMGLYKPYKLNQVASALYGGDIVGDVVFCTTFNPDPFAEPDIYAMPFDEAMRLRKTLSKLCSVVSEQGCPKQEEQD